MTRIGNWPDPAEQGKTVTLVGAGPLGAHLVPEIAHLPGVQAITLIDPACCGEQSLLTGEVTRRDLGRPKVDVQARRARRINPHLRLRPMHARVETVPLARLRSGVILAALDSAAARRRLNRAAWRLGAPWVDGRVGRRGLAVQVRSDVPGPDATCLVCGGQAGDDGPPAQPVVAPRQGTATGASAGGAAVAAGLMTIECMRLLDGDGQDLGRGRQVLMDLRRHVVQATPLRRDAPCPFDHAIWDIEALAESPTKLTVAQAIRAAAGRRGLCPRCYTHLRPHPACPDGE